MRVVCNPHVRPDSLVGPAYEATRSFSLSLNFGGAHLYYYVEARGDIKSDLQAAKASAERVLFQPCTPP